MMYLRLLYVLLGISKILTAEPLSPSQSTFKIVYRIRIYQRVGRSREQWREMIPPDVRDTPSTETKERCAAGLVSPSDENKTKAEQLGVQNRSVGQHLPKCRVFHHSLRICQGWKAALILPMLLKLHTLKVRL